MRSGHARDALGRDFGHARDAFGMRSRGGRDPFSWISDKGLDHVWVFWDFSGHFMENEDKFGLNACSSLKIEGKLV